MSDLSTLKRLLATQAGAVAAYLLPQGIREGREWCAGSVRGEPGHSLKVCISGGKAGVWQDFAEGGESAGDMIDLWQAVRGCDLPKALDEIRSYLGVEQPNFERDDRRVYRRPERPKCRAPESAVLEYLTKQRKISASALMAYQVGEQGRKIIFPFLIDGELIMAKWRAIDKNQKGKNDTQPTEGGCEHVLFGWQSIDRNAREVVITEGEIDALTAYDYGFPALSVPFGGGGGKKQDWIESEYDRLLRFEIIYIATDMDEEGDLAAEEIANRLGRHRCRRIRLPRKDFNDCRKDGIGADEIAKAVEESASLDPPELRRMGAFRADIQKLFHPPEGREPGYRMPLGKIRDRVVFRPGEVTLWSGATGAGKSQLLGHTCVDMGDQGARVCIASLEMIPKIYLKRMVKQAGNSETPTTEYIDAIVDWMDTWLWVLAAIGKRDVTRVLECFEYSRARYGCDVFVIDSLMRLGISPDDYEAQEKAVFEIVSWAVERQVHVHLVAHARKGGGRDSDTPQETDDVKGTSEIAANAANIVIVWRNRKHEAALQKAQEAAGGGDEAAIAKLIELQAMPSLVVKVPKQRTGDWEGSCGAWYNMATYQYRSAVDKPRGKYYVEFSRASNEDDEAAL